MTKHREIRRTHFKRLKIHKRRWKKMAKDGLQGARALVEDLETRISLLQESIRNANLSLPVLASELVSARAILAIEVRKAEEIHYGRLRNDLQEVLAHLDANGWDPARERKATEILAAFRMARRSGNSAEALRLYIERLRNPSGGREPKRSWSNLLNWIQPAEKVA
jgi:hypothetical protein